MNNAKQIIKAIGTERVMTELGVKRNAISAATVQGSFPTAWFKVLTDLGRKTGVDVPFDMFRWKHADMLEPAE